MKTASDPSGEQPRPLVDDVNLLRGDFNGLIESRTELLRSMARIEEVLTIRRDQPVPEAVPNNPRQVQELLEDLRVDSAEDP